ncbi:MAG TPA: helix-turn-helix domain-containing protein [Chitinophagaceae bacterium]|jgi:AraC-like DNA-binding protein|nr:helix-turn-helix domain-containing protein [Chitinophagaceae bacterium]
MKTQLLLPPLSISRYVQSIIVIEDYHLEADFVIPLIARGYPSIVFQDTGQCISGNRTDRLVLYGQNVKPFHFNTTERVIIIAFFLYPHLLKSIFGFGAKESRDISIDLGVSPQAKKINLTEQLLNAPSLSIRLQLMTGFIQDLCEASWSDENQSILFATSQIIKDKGLSSPRTIREKLHLTERTFERLFETHVGVSPKLFNKICQFHSAFQQFSNRNYNKLSDVAFENGYSDQSHFIRVFKEFTNLTPGEYLKNVPRQED